jgi:anti-sigma factor RsiW
MPDSADEMTCRELVGLITDYVEGTLPDGDRRRFDEHVEMCKYCAGYLEQMRATIGALGELPEETISPHVRDELLDAFRGWKSR